MTYLEELFSLHDQVAVVTGGTGVLGSAFGLGLARAGARIAVLGRDQDRGRSTVEQIEQAGGEAMLVLADVLHQDELHAARDAVLRQWGQIDILMNAAGGGVPNSTTTEQMSFFDLPRSGMEAAIDLNFLGTLLPTQVFGASMAERGHGSIVNISSVAAPRPLTTSVSYGASKAGIEHFTRWLAVEVASRFGPGLRVNCIEPGFFLAIQNRSALVHEDGSPTERGAAAINHTPMKRFGEPEELVSALIWLCGPGASFVTGCVVPVDGGFTSFAGV